MFAVTARVQCRMPWIAAPRKNVRIMVGPGEQLIGTAGNILTYIYSLQPYLLLFCHSSWFWFLYGKPHHLTSRLCRSFQATFPLCDYTTYMLTSTCTGAFVSIGHPSSKCNRKGYFADEVLSPQVPTPAAAAPQPPCGGAPAACKHHQPFPLLLPLPGTFPFSPSSILKLTSTPYSLQLWPPLLPTKPNSLAMIPLEVCHVFNK